MNVRRNIFALGAAAALLLCTPAAIAANLSYERCIEAASNYRYSEALMHFMAAAEQGDRSAQRNLGLMFLYGDRLYGHEVQRNLAQAKRWFQAADG